MKPSISSTYYYDLDAYEMPKAFIKSGLYQTEINDFHYRKFMTKEDNVKEYRKYIDDLGFSIPQGHLIFMNEGNITSYDNTYAIDNLKRNLEVFYELGVKAAVLHYSNYGSDVVPVDEWFDVRIEALNKLISHIKGTDMVICLENLSRIHDHDAGHLLKMCKAVDDQSHIGICLDTGHLNISQGGNPYDFIMQAGKFLKAMHINGNRGEIHGLKGGQCDWHLMPFGGDSVNWSNVKRGIKDVNYQGLFSYELDYNGICAAAPLEVKKVQAKYLLELYKTYFEF